ncbi:MAG: RnfABCDGE type electron transport complex subunit C [Defluviitaleaceae bacterium]|nr:RnfABCDGE type electron transport complex subunit C [Defluviitaleaceae bacterium]
MGFFSGKSSLMVDGKKGLTNQKAIETYTQPKVVAIPLKNRDSDNFEIHVEVGSKVKIGTVLAMRKDHLKVPCFSSVSGTVLAIEKKDHVSTRKTNHIVIENDFQDEKERYADPVEELSTLSVEEIKEKLQLSGVMGLGGTELPIYEKYRDVDEIETLLINGVECEPYLTSDEANMKTSATLLFDGIYLLMKAASAKKGILAITKGKKELYDALKPYENSYPNVEIKQMDDVYPMGWEKYLIRRLFKKTYDQTPAELGILCVNSSTVIEFARSVRSGLPLYERIVTLAGEGFVHQQNVKVRVGTLLADVVAAIGGYVEEVGFKTARLIHGGPLMGTSIITDDLAVTATTNGFLCLLESLKEESPCSRCGACIDHCPAGLQPVQMAQAVKNKDVGMLKTLAADACVGCGLCSFVCPSSINVTKSSIRAKSMVLRG